MREIKFRGICHSTGQVVTGDLHHWNGLCFINSWRVREDSVSQLCFVDSDGNEIYEGDTVTSHGQTFTVSLEPTANGEDVIFINDSTYTFNKR